MKIRLIQGMIVVVIVGLSVYVFGNPESETVAYAIPRADAPASKQVPMEALVYLPQFEELVAFGGSYDASWRWTANGAGGHQLLWSADFSRITGRGVSSGVEYRIMDPPDCTVPLDDRYPCTTVARESVRVVSESSAMGIEAIWETTLTVLGSLVKSPEAIMADSNLRI